MSASCGLSARARSSFGNAARAASGVEPPPCRSARARLNSVSGASGAAPAPARRRAARRGSHRPSSPACRGCCGSSAARARRCGARARARTRPAPRRCDRPAGRRCRGCAPPCPTPRSWLGVLPQRDVVVPHATARRGGDRGDEQDHHAQAAAARRAVGSRGATSARGEIADQQTEPREGRYSNVPRAARRESSREWRATAPR
jgi:hypothetical protein